MAVRLIEGKLVRYDGGVLTDSGYRGDHITRMGTSKESIRRDICRELRERGLLGEREGIILTGTFTETEYSDKGKAPERCPICSAELKASGSCPDCRWQPPEDDI